MADATPGDTSSTPTAVAVAPSATAPATATATPPVTPAASAAPATDTTPATAQPTPATTDSSPATTATTADTAPKTDATQATAPAKPAFTLPVDMTLSPEAVTKFTDFVTAKTPDAEGKFTLTAQELVDVYATQARDAQQRWHSHMATQDKTWEAESKARFTPAQLAASETGIGFLTSFEPAFRELAKSFLNHPSFVNAMRVVGERLSEDTFEISGAPPPQPQKRAAKDILYPKRATN